MAEIQITALLAAYEEELGKLRGELIRQRVGFQAEIAELKEQLRVSESASSEEADSKMEV